MDCMEEDNASFTLLEEIIFSASGISRAKTTLSGGLMNGGLVARKDANPKESMELRCTQAEVLLCLIGGGYNITMD